jgi:hypothetical protein
MIRTPFRSERIERIDPLTGIKVIQVTSYPITSFNFGYAWPMITPDNRRFVFATQRYARRDAPWDIWRCDTDGLNLFQLTERGADNDFQPWPPAAALTLDGRTVYAVWPPDGVLCRIDLESGTLEELADLSRYCPEGTFFGGIQLHRSGEFLIAARRGIPTGSGCLRIDLGSGAIAEFAIDGIFVACEHERDRLLMLKNPNVLGTEERTDGTRIFTNLNKTPMEFWTTDLTGKAERFHSPWNYAHATLHGRTSTIQGCGLPPERCIWMAEEGKEPYKLVQGPYFWHSGPSFDGEWIVADTNWPDDGLQLVHVPSRHFRALCHPGATEGHVQEGHPHPGLSQDGRVCLFGSDRTGTRQVYVAHITEEFRESVIAGELDRPKDKWI